MKKYNTFIFETYTFERETKTLLLEYSFDGELFFEEKIEFPTENKITDEELACLNNIFRYIHIVAGISYYKLFVPSKIEIKTFDLDEKQAKFFNDFYFNGLGEFAFKNNILDIKERINFPYNHNIDNSSPKEANFHLRNKIVIPIGGGKDSTTTLNIIKKFYKNEDILLCSVGRAKPIDETIALSGCKSFHPIRTISKNLIELNKKLDEIGGYNGHVPISGILAFIVCAGAVIYGYDNVLMSNERSANVGNTEFAGTTVNHQWSKSFEFEKNVNNFFKEYMLKDFNYFSFLRPLSEIHIAKLFSRYKEYFPVFTSCNKNFKIENRLDHWCCDCDKCRFVFLILAVFLKKDELIKIFGKDLLNEESQISGYRDLCGLDNYKPFECVGEIEESVYSILNIDESFKNDLIVKKLTLDLDKKYSKDYIKELEKKLFSIEKDNNLLGEKFFHYLEEDIKDDLIKNH